MNNNVFNFGIENTIYKILDEANTLLGETKVNIYGDIITLKDIKWSPDYLTRFETNIQFKKITIPGVYPNRYFISKNGYIISVNNPYNDKALYLLKNKINKDQNTIALSRDKNYPNPNKNPNDNHYYISIHKLVKMIWDPGDVSYKTMLNPVIKHIDGNTLNNNVENLAWIERTDHKLFGKTNDEYSKLFKTTNEIESVVKEIKNNPNESISSMSKRLDISRGQITNIKYGISWSKYSGINKGDYNKAFTPIRLTDNQIQDISSMILQRKTDCEISEKLNIPIHIVKDIRAKHVHKNVTESLDFIPNNVAKYKNIVIGNEGDSEVLINDKIYKLVDIPNILKNKYYISKDNDLQVIDWRIKYSKPLRVFKRTAGRLTYVRVILLKTDKSPFEIRVDQLGDYVWNKHLDIKPIWYQLFETGKNYKVIPKSRPTPMTREKAEEIAKYIVDHPNESSISVGERFGFSRNAISHLKSGDTFKDICEKYNLSSLVKNKPGKLEDEKILQIADYIVAHPDETVGQIANKFNTSNDVIIRIRTKSAYKHLLTNYDFSFKSRKSFSYDDKIAMCNMKYNLGLGDTEIGKIMNRSREVIKQFFKSSFVQEWLANTVSMRQIQYILSTQKVTPFTKPDSDGYVFTNSKPVTPFDIK